MNQEDIRINNIDSLGELRNKVKKDQLIICDDSPNSFCIVNFNDVREYGVAYCHYGISQAFQYSGDGTILYWGIGMRLMCLDTCEYKILVDDSLSSVFFELCYDSSKNYICVICELDVYGYYMGKRIWERGVRDIIVGYEVIDGNTISILSNDGLRFEYIMKDGKSA